MKVWTSINEDEYKKLTSLDKIVSESEFGYTGYVSLDSVYRYPLSMTLLANGWSNVKVMLGIFSRAKYLVELDVQASDLMDCDKESLTKDRRWAVYNGMVLQVNMKEILLENIAGIYECRKVADVAEEIVPTQYMNSTKCPMMSSSLEFDLQGRLAIVDEHCQVSLAKDQYLRVLRNEMGMHNWLKDMTIREVQFAGDKATVEQLGKVYNLNKMSYEDTFYTMEELMKR